MTPQTIVLPEGELDRRVAAFEAAWATDRSADLVDFLPPRETPEYPQVLAELIRIDLEFRGARGQSPRFEAYRPQAPALFRDPAWVGELAFEEYRQRLTLGEPARPDEYAARYGVDVAHWPPPAAVRPEPPTFPDAGGVFGPFRILRELGRGAFGRVYLAAQTDLADRPVAVKLSTRFGRTEPETLARLQHTHVVPIYSSQRIGSVQLIVMPYLGATTLADVLAALRDQGAWPTSGQALADTVARRASRTRVADDLRPAAAPPRSPLHLPLEQLRKLTFPEAVLWIGWKLAEALAHAHDRGILHRDIKPANVLVTDEGQPMLLDFNLASDANRDEQAGVGGTPAYMAPEQVEAMKGGTRPVDHRADLYSLGLVLAEMLLGRSPFSGGSARPVLRAGNSSVSPSTEAILQKCLAADPADRYASAGQLAEEFRRQLAHLPLAATREPSPAERLRKWRRRHPLLASTGSVAALATLFILLLVGSLIARDRHLRNLTEERAAVQKYRDFEATVPVVVDRVTVLDRAASREGSERLDGLLARYGVLQNGSWADEPDVRRLPAAERDALHEQVGELLLLKSNREPVLQAALRLNEQAAAAFQKRGDIPRTVWDERRRLAERLGRDADARAYEEHGRQTPIQSRDWYYSGLSARGGGQHAEAVRLFEAAVEHDPRHYWSWLLLGDAWTILERDDKAEGCFNACIALKPDLFMAYYNRGWCHFRREAYAAAAADFSRVLSLHPDHEKALIARGLARQQAGELADAETDFTQALGDGSTETRLYFRRAEVRASRGNAAGAALDHAEGMKRLPIDELSWITRGIAKWQANDPRGAVADYDEALKLNPRSYFALLNKATTLDDKLHQEPDAIRVLDTALELYPDKVAARAGRAVLLARQGNRKAAHADAEQCLAANPKRDVLYQLAGVYALTSRIEPGDAKSAYRLLRRALQDGYGFDLLAIDPDLAPIRGQAEFREIAEAARALQPSQK